MKSRIDWTPIAIGAGYLLACLLGLAYLHSHPAPPRREVTQAERDRAADDMAYTVLFLNPAVTGQ